MQTIPDVSEVSAAPSSRRSLVQNRSESVTAHTTVHTVYQEKSVKIGVTVPSDHVTLCHEHGSNLEPLV